MVDRLMPVGSQGSRWQAELPVEVDGRGEGEDARGDAADQSVRGSREMALQAELSLSELTIRFAPEEADLLSYHAYWSTHARLGALYPDMVVGRPSWRDYEALTTDEVNRLERLLTLGVKRLRVRV
jgi:hypothetical protein